MDVFITENGETNSFEARARVDLNRTLVTIPYPHDAVHRDGMVNASHIAASASTDLLYLITCDPAKEVHLEFIITAGGAAQVYVYESPTVSDAGTGITSARLYRPSTKTIDTVITVGPTVSDEGTLLKELYNGGGGQGSGIRGGSSAHEGAEWVFKVDTEYLIKIVRATSQIVGVEFEWYEVPPYGGRQ